MTSYPRWLLLLLLLATGCQSEATKTTSSAPDSNVAATSAPSPSFVDVTLALNWFPEAEHGGFYAALRHGYFEEEGLNVSIKGGGPKAPVIPQVADGNFAFGVDNSDKLLLARAQQADVVAVLAPIQNSPRCIMVHKKSGLSRLEDLAHLKQFTLAINPGQPFAQYLKKKLNLENIQIVQYGGNVAAFLEDANYGQQAYSFSEPFVAEQKQSDPQCLMLSEIGFNIYTSVLLTRREMIEKQPGLVAKMTRASIRGWQKYLAEPEETNKLIHEQNSEMGLEILAFGAQALKPLCLPDGFDEGHLGEMTTKRWDTLISQMTEIGLLKPESVKPEDAFTPRFLIIE